MTRMNANQVSKFTSLFLTLILICLICVHLADYRFMRAEKPRRLTDASAVRVPGRAPRWIVPSVKAALVIADALAAALSFIFALPSGRYLCFRGTRWAWSNRFAPYGAMLVLVVLIRLLTLRSVGSIEFAASSLLLTIACDCLKQRQLDRC